MGQVNFCMLPQRWKTGIRRVAFLVYTFADVGHTILGNNVTPIEHQMEAIIYHLHDNEENRHRGAVDAEGSSGGWKSLRKNTHHNYDGQAESYIIHTK